MKVRDVMMGTPYCTSLQANLGMAAEQMWKGNCGFLPVLDAEQKVCGVVTDRDICIALGTRNQIAGEVLVETVMPPRLFSCGPDEEIHMALQTMREGRVRRLPVVDAAGRPVGVVSMDDVLLHVETKRTGMEPELSAEEVVRSYRTILKKDLPISVKKASA